jgi:hypothetical protein
VTLSREARGGLRLQLSLAGVGAAVWYAGVVADSGFLAGLGVGVLVSALALRFLVRRM